MNKGKDVNTVIPKFGIFCLIILCVLGLGYYFTVSAQDNARLEVKIEAPPNGGDNVIYMEKLETSSTEQRAFIKTEDGKTVIIDAEKSGSAKSEKQMSKEEKKEIKSEMQMNKGGLPPADMKNQEAKKGRENKQDQNQSKGQPQAPTPAFPQAQAVPQPQGQPQPPAPNNEGVNLYINSIYQNH
jgi:hypothetical protein